MITFNLQDVKYKLSNRNEIRAWLKSEILSLGFKPGDINFILCNDDYLLKLNIKYLKHNTLTDILTFDYSEKGKLSGDIFLSVERIWENAKKFEKPIENEVLRVMIHGVLHLSGLKDKKQEEKAMMRTKEDESIARYFISKQQNKI